MRSHYQLQLNSFKISSVTLGSSLIFFAQESAQFEFFWRIAPKGAGKLCACNFQMYEWGIVKATNPSIVVCAGLPESMFSPMLCGKMNSDGRLIGV